MPALFLERAGIFLMVYKTLKYSNSYICSSKEPSMYKLCDIVNGMIERNVPFFIYRLPTENKIRCGIQCGNQVQKDTPHHLIGQEGFLFAPFENNEAYIIRPDLRFDLPGDLTRFNNAVNELPFVTSEEESYPFKEVTFEEYLAQCAQYIEDIRAGKAEKAILSRCVKSSLLNRQHSGECFERLEASYADAYVFLVNIPGVGTWVGASPETLLRVENGHFTTMALAGTRRWVEGLTEYVDKWPQKEKREQAIVTEYICEQLASISITDVACDSLKVKKAGGVGHLQTLIQGTVKGNQIAALIQALHPTPAVCGSPKLEALRLIHEIESHSRDFYAGYLGYQEANGDLALFVNLRSARLLNEYGLLYVGGGITADSVPEEEWEETCMKAQTILNALN